MARVGISSTRSVAAQVDAILAADKELFGEPFWRDGNRIGEEARLDWPVLVAGESANCKLCVTAYPNIPQLRFTITLNWEDRNIWRLDHEVPDRPEINPILRGHELSGLSIKGPHIHAWADNRHAATFSSVPDPMLWKRPLPENVKGWDSAFRWFLGVTNVAQPRSIPALPGRTRLV